jgi:hypothetical protein
MTISPLKVDQGLSLYHLHSTSICPTIAFPPSLRRAMTIACVTCHFDTHWRSFADSEACDFSAKIEQFKACQLPMLANGVPYHGFLCSMFFYAAFLAQPQFLDNDLYVLTECTQQLVLAAEGADPRTQLWLEKELNYKYTRNITVQFTKHTHKALQLDLQRALTAIEAHVCLLNFTLPFLKTENTHVVPRNSGRLAFLDWKGQGVVYSWSMCTEPRALDLQC